MKTRAHDSPAAQQIAISTLAPVLVEKDLSTFGSADFGRESTRVQIVALAEPGYYWGILVARGRIELPTP
jgi:hypothetical protein